MPRGRGSWRGGRGRGRGTNRGSDERRPRRRGRRAQHGAPRGGRARSATSTHVPPASRGRGGGLNTGYRSGPRPVVPDRGATRTASSSDVRFVAYPRGVGAAAPALPIAPRPWSLHAPGMIPVGAVPLSLPTHPYGDGFFAGLAASFVPGPAAAPTSVAQFGGWGATAGPGARGVVVSHTYAPRPAPPLVPPSTDFLAASVSRTLFPGGWGSRSGNAPISLNSDHIVQPALLKARYDRIMTSLSQHSQQGTAMPYTASRSDDDVPTARVSGGVSQQTSASGHDKIDLDAFAQQHIRAAGFADELAAQAWCRRDLRRAGSSSVGMVPVLAVPLLCCSFGRVERRQQHPVSVDLQLRSLVSDFQVFCGFFVVDDGGRVLRDDESPFRVTQSSDSTTFAPGRNIACQKEGEAPIVELSSFKERLVTLRIHFVPQVDPATGSQVLGWSKAWLVSVVASHIGRGTAQLQLISRRLSAFVYDIEDSKLSVEAPRYIPDRLKAYFDAEWPTIRGSQEQRRKVLPDLPDMKRAPLPDAHLLVSEKISTERMKDLVAKSARPPEDLSEATYGPHFQSLLLAEAAQMLVDIRKYDLLNAELSPDEFNRAKIVVVGATENRPSLAYGDVVRLRPDPVEHPCELEAFVTSVRDTIVTLQLPDRLGVDMCAACHASSATCIAQCGHFVVCGGALCIGAVTCPLCREVVEKCQDDDGGVRRHREVQSRLYNGKFHVRFVAQRKALLHALRALRDVMEPGSRPRIPRSILFPTADALAVPPEIVASTASSDVIRVLESEVRRLARIISPVCDTLNEEQRIAVAAILSGWHGSVPFLLHGPPGTGKTLTVCEAVFQLLARAGCVGDATAHRDHAVRLLVVTPSDWAADIVTDRLREAGIAPDVMIRVNSSRRMVPSAMMSTFPFCRIDGSTGTFVIPTLEQVRSFACVVCTNAGAGTLVSLGIPVGHFTHIIADESSQAIEPETLIPLSLAGPTTRVTLAGDPCQLGAVLRSPIANTLGLATSLQERLMSRDVYKHSGCVVGVRLADNYRSHKRIIEISSALFYDRSLRARAAPGVVESMALWEALPQDSQFPLLCVGVQGDDAHEIDSPSFYNTVEARKVVTIVKQLLSSKTVRAEVKDIGIITPYRKQVLLLRKMLRSEGRLLGNVRVGSVGDYQGQESRITIVSTTLSQRHGASAARAAMLRAREAVRLGNLASAARAEAGTAHEEALRGHESLASGGAGGPARSDANPEVAGSGDDGAEGGADEKGDPRLRDGVAFGAVGVGLFGDPKRFNVALTRAKALSIVVGDPWVLAEDPFWRTLLSFCVLHGSYTGCVLPELDIDREFGGVEEELLIEEMASTAMRDVLGHGDLSLMYPTDLDEMYRLQDAYQDDREWRVSLTD